MSKVYKQSELGFAQLAVLDRVKPNSRVLEIGCATGHMTEYLSAELGCEVTAVEADASQAAQAEKFCARMIVGDIEQENTWRECGKDFDAVIFADVLEHLKDPWTALRRAKEVLKNDGRVLVSLPNIAYFRIRLQMLLGEFNYTDFGILDNTHLRFFTASTARGLLEDSGYRIDEFVPIYRDCRRRKLILNRLFSNAQAYQFVIMASPNNS